MVLCGLLNLKKSLKNIKRMALLLVFFDLFDSAEIVTCLSHLKRVEQHQVRIYVKSRQKNDPDIVCSKLENVIQKTVFRYCDKIQNSYRTKSDYLCFKVSSS